MGMGSLLNLIKCLVQDKWHLQKYYNINLKKREDEKRTFYDVTNSCYGYLPFW